MPQCPVDEIANTRCQCELCSLPPPTCPTHTLIIRNTPERNASRHSSVSGIDRRTPPLNPSPAISISLGNPPSSLVSPSLPSPWVLAPPCFLPGYPRRWCSPQRSPVSWGAGAAGYRSVSSPRPAARSPLYHSRPCPSHSSHFSLCSSHLIAGLAAPRVAAPAGASLSAALGRCSPSLGVARRRGASWGPRSGVHWAVASGSSPYSSRGCWVGSPCHSGASTLRGTQSGPSGRSRSHRPPRPQGAPGRSDGA
jgi:hypothetical protein